jgi:hypothetical protein
MIANALPRPLTTGSVDNAILRADGTGGATLQNSGLIIEDTVVSFPITGDAGTDYITAVGNNFTTNQRVMFQSLTGGSGLFTRSQFFNAWYFVRDIGGAGAGTFKVSLTSGGAAENFSTPITAGSIVAIQPSVAITPSTTDADCSVVLRPKGVGGIIGLTPTGTSTTGYQRGNYAVDLQLAPRTNVNQVALSDNSALLGGELNAITQGGSGPKNSAIIGGFNNTISATAESNFLAGGYQNVISAASTLSGIIGGGICEIKKRDSFIGAGRYNVVDAECSAILGGGNGSVGNEIVSNQSGILAGFAARCDRVGMQSHANGRFANNGDAQRARFVMRNKTTTNSAVELFLDGSATRLTIPSGKIFAFTINISGVKSDGSAVAHYLRQYCLKNVAGTMTQVYAPVTIGTDNAAGTTIALSANDTNDALKVEVTGIAAETWRWVASVDAVEIAYGI